MISSLHRPSTLAKVDLSVRRPLNKWLAHPQTGKDFAVVKANAYGHGAVEVQ